MVVPVPYFTEKTAYFFDLLKELVEIESPSSDKSAVDEDGARIIEELGKLGAEVSIDHQEFAGNHVIGRWKAGIPKKGILLLCHMDTVHPHGTLVKNPCILQDGKLFGPGTQDMKGGIVVVLGAVKVLRELNAWVERPITALFTSDEEAGSKTSRTLIENLAREAGLALCFETALPGGALKTSRKGVGRFEITAHGRPAHAGADHEKGINAIEELARQVIEIQSWTDYSLGTTLNTGRIQGGTVSNVVPAEARAVVDFRVSVPAEAERVVMLMQSLHPHLEGASLEISGGLNRPPLPRDEQMVETFRKARRIAARLGFDLEEGSTGGSSDANFVAPLHVPVLDGLGALGDGQHTEHEYVYIDSLPTQAALLAAILTEW